MAERHFQKTDQSYHRAEQKGTTQDLLDEYYDPEIEDSDVGGGDPGIAELMASALRLLEKDG